MSTAFDSVPAEAAKDRSSIRLMDLPMQQPKKKKLSSSSPDTPSQDTKNLPSAPEEATSARVVTSIPRTASTSDPVGTSDQQQTLQQQQQETQDQAQDRDLQQQQQLSEQQAVHLKTLDNQVEKPKPVVESTRVATVEMGSGSSSQPSRYETREERQIRIRKQFNQLDQKRSGFLDTNSLVSFFADITPDKNVQRRYADELLQLCHSRRSRDHHHHHHHHHHNTNGNGNGNGSHDSGNGSSHGNGHENGGGSPDSDSPDDSNSHDDDHQNCNGDHGDEDDDGHVRYDDFEVFVEEKEERLWNLFREIDHNNDNEIQPEELQASLAKAGINLSDADLQRFIKAMDKDGDGMIDFEEWRDFLVLLPRETTLKEIFHYVQEVVAQVGVDGDVVMPPSENDYVARYLLAGAIAGAVSRTATAPLDRLKVYLITNATPITTGPIAQEALKRIPKFSSPKTTGAVTPVRQRLLWTAITELYHQGGVKTFFRGNGLNIIKIAPESAIKFYTYETSKSFIVHHLPSLCIQPHHPNGHAAKAQHRDIATSGRFLAGGIAGLVSQFSIYPLETIKTRMMSSTGRSHQAPSSSSSAPVTSSLSSGMSSSSSSPSSSLKSLSALSLSASGGAAGGANYPKQRLTMKMVVQEIWQKTGLRGFYRGLGPSLVGIFPYAAIDLSVFETLKFGYMRWKAGVHEGDEGSEEKALERPSVFVLLACGTISGSVGATSVYPLSLVRTRMQAQGTPHHPQTYTSTLDVFRKTYEKEGVRGFYKGMVPTLTKVVPAVSISYVVYEYSKRELGL